MQKNNSNTVNIVRDLVKPIINDLGLELWDIEFVKEGSELFLRIYIDKAGEVGIDDCERVSKAIDKPLDDLDPINSAYNLEVSSPGVERKLTKPQHFERFINSEVKIKLIKPDENGEIEYIANLKQFLPDENQIIIETSDKNEKAVNLKDTAYVKLNKF